MPASLQRNTALGADDAWGGLQGLFLLTRFPDKWLLVQAQALQSLKDPKLWYEIAGQPRFQYTMEHMPGAIWEGIHSGIKPEFFSSTEAIGKIPLIGKGLKAVYERFGTAFITAGNLARLYWGEAMLPVAEKANMGPHMVDFINHATGAMDTAGMGIGKGQRAVEGGMLFLAPRYLRSVLAVTGDILNSGAAPEAIRSVSSLFIGGTYAYTRLAEASGQEPIYDLRDSRAYSLNVGGVRVGVGSAVRALVTFGAKLASDPEALLSGDPKVNPAVQWWRPRLPLGPSVGYDIAMNEDFRHNKIRGEENWIADSFSFIRVVGQKFLPAAVDGLMVERGNGLQKTGGAVAAFFGARVNPETIGDVRERVAVETFGQKYLDLGPVERRQVDNDPRAKMPDLPSGHTFERQRQVKSAHDKYSRDLEVAAAGYYSSPAQHTGASLRKYIGDIATRRNVELDLVDNIFPETRQAPALTPAIAADRAQRKVFENYLELLRKENVVTGVVDRAAAEDYKNTRPQAEQDYIDQRFLAAAEGLGSSGRRASLELRAARDVLQPYWELRQEVMTDYDTWEPFTKMNPYQQAEYMQTREYQHMETRWERYRDIMRRRDHEIDRALVLYYGAKPKPGRDYSIGE